ncbi:hypothetical protein MXB_144 [Myxobolus squamalis]|nr:hypothetical protein MXB_144 [Myxobolus squamalis]
MLQCAIYPKQHGRITSRILIKHIYFKGMHEIVGVIYFTFSGGKREEIPHVEMDTFFCFSCYHT